MLQVNPEAEQNLYRTVLNGSDPGLASLKAGPRFRRQWPLIAVLTSSVILIAILYLIIAPSKYTANAIVLINSTPNQVFEKDKIIADVPVDTSIIDSQVEVVKSESVLLTAIHKLDLTKDPEFKTTDKNLFWIIIGKISSIFSQDGSQPQLDPDTRSMHNAIETISRNLDVRRVKQTYAIEIDYTSKDAAKSAQIVNAIADSYLVSELDAKLRATRLTGEWLQDRLKELQSLSTAADEAVRQFKEENNLVDTSRGLVSQQQMTDLNTQLIQARAITAEAKAKLDSVRGLSDRDMDNTKISDALKSDIISRLRAQYLDLAAKERDWSARYGATHLATIQLRNQMHEISRSISSELNRIAETYDSDYKIALSRERSIEVNLNKIVSESAGATGKAKVRLRTLESTADSYHNLYENLLQRSVDASQQQKFSVSGAEIITAATTPMTRSSPKTLLILTGAALLGTLFGICAAFARERMDSTFRTSAQIEQLTGQECLGILPKISLPEKKKSPNFAERMLPTELGIFRYVTEAPFSRFAETLRGVKVAVDFSGTASQSPIVGFISALPREGKTTVAANFAALLAQNGYKLLLIDGDLRNPSMTRELIGETKRGLITVIQDLKEMSQVVWRDPISGFDFLPVETELHIIHTSHIISSTRMAQILARSRESYDFIIIDLPPITPVVDVKAISHLIDKFVMIVEWGNTSKEAVLEALNKIGSAREQILGVVLNNADPQALRRLEIYLGHNYDAYYHNKKAPQFDRHSVPGAVEGNDVGVV